MLKYDVENSVGYHLASAQRAFMSALRDRLAPHGITYRQAEILGWLALEGSLSQAELAHRMMIEPPSLVGTLDRMEASGLLERKACAEDRRKNLVQATSAAEGMWEQIMACAREIRALATQGLSEEEIGTLKDLLRRVRVNCTTPEPVVSHS